MNQTNSIVIDGNLVRDSVFCEPKQDFHVCRFTVAVNRWYKNENGESVCKVSFFDVETYGNSADFCTKYCKKGQPVRIIGRLQQDRWKNKEGKSESKVYLVGEHIELLKRPEPVSSASAQESQNDSSTVTESELAEGESLVRNEYTETEAQLQEAELVEAAVF